MNKSKFLKRSLAALLAILMVAALIPMSAFAAVTIAEDAPTARVFTDPGYSIWVNNNEAEWDAENNAYTADKSFPEGGSVGKFDVSMIQNVKNTTVTVKETGDKLSNTNVQLDPADAAENTADAFGAGTYTYTLVAEVTDDDGEIVSTDEYLLVITVTMRVRSEDATIKAVKTAKLPYAIRATVDNDKNTIDIIMALGKEDTHITNIKDMNNANVTVSNVLREIFIPNNDDALSVGYSAGVLTVTAENGSIKEFAVSFTSEPAFNTFKLGDYEATIDEDDPTNIVIDLPYDEFINAAHNDMDTSKLAGLIASWTVPTGVKVYEGTADNACAIVESGKFKPSYGATSTVTVDDVDYYIVSFDSSDKVFVQTRKSGATPVAVTITLRVPQKNPNAELTGIQVGTNNQYFPVTGTTMNVALPAGVSKTTKQTISVWGSYNATVELAKDSSDNDDADDQRFEVHGGALKTLDPDTAAVSDTALKVDAPLVFKITSEDGKNTAFYTINVTESKSNPVLTSLQFVDDDGEVVAEGNIAAGSGGTKSVEITVPFAYGIDMDALKGLTVLATADSSSKVEIDHMTYAGGSAVNAVYVSDTYQKPTIATDTDSTKSDHTFDVEYNRHTYSHTSNVTTTEVTDDQGTGTGQYTHTIDDDEDTILSAFASDYNANAGDDDWTASAENGVIKLTANTAGSLDTLGIEAPDGTEDTEGKDAGVTGTGTPNAFVKSDSLNTVIGVDELSTAVSVAGEGTETTIPTTKVSDDPAAGNTFKIYVSNSASTNNTTTYNVTITKKAPSSTASITSAKVAAGDVVSIDSNTVSYPATVTGSGQNRTIKVSTLPYALQKAAEDNVANARKMVFSELEVSEGTRVVYFDPIADGTIYMEVDSDGKIASKAFYTWEDGTIDNSWAKSGKEVLLYVYSEKDWDAIDPISKVSPGGDASFDSGYNLDRFYAVNELLWSHVHQPNIDTSDWDRDPTATYKMSATYAAAETGAQLNSIASTLDENIKVEKVSNTITITVPGSYVDSKEFSLNMDVSKFATIHKGEASAELKSDEGSEDTVSPALFKVVTNGQSYKLQYSTDDGSNYDDFDDNLFVISESENNKNSWIVKVKVAAKESSAEIESITVDGVSAVKDVDDEYVWLLELPYGTDQVQPLDIETVSKLADVQVDDAAYDSEGWYDLGADIEIDVTSEDGANHITYTLKMAEGEASSNNDLAEVRAGAYTAVKGEDNAWTMEVPEGTDMSEVSLTVRTADEGAKVTSVNGEEYTPGMPVDLSEGETVTIVVTAANGISATHTLTVTFGSTGPGPDGNESDKYIDLDQVNPGGTMLEDVKAAIDMGIMGSTSTEVKQFSPKQQIRRRDFAVVIARADLIATNEDITNLEEADATLEEMYSGTPAFSDIDSLDNVQKAAIGYCAEKGIISGRDENTFDHANYISRQEVAVMLAQWCELTVDKEDTDNKNDATSADWNEASSWAKPYINAVVSAGLMSGMGSNRFGPKGNVTREQAAVILVNVFGEKYPDFN